MLVSVALNNVACVKFAPLMLMVWKSMPRTEARVKLAPSSTVAVVMVAPARFALVKLVFAR